MRTTAIFCMMVAVVAPALAETHSIPPEKVDRQKIYWGNAEEFEKAGEVDYVAVIKATPQFEELRKKRIERGTARFYYLMNQASEHAVRAIVAVGRQTDFDLVVAKGFLASLDNPIEASDLTDLVLERLRNGDASS